MTFLIVILVPWLSCIPTRKMWQVSPDPGGMSCFFLIRLGLLGAVPLICPKPDMKKYETNLADSSVSPRNVPVHSLDRSGMQHHHRRLPPLASHAHVVPINPSQSHQNRPDAALWLRDLCDRSRHHDDHVRGHCEWETPNVFSSCSGPCTSAIIRTTAEQWWWR